MWILSRARLRAFWEKPGRGKARGPLSAWHAVVRLADWQNPAEVRGDFPTASFVGNCTVFNIGGNKYRLVTRILFPSHKVYILRVMTHAEYDREPWAEECGCHSPPPRREE